MKYRGKRWLVLALGVLAIATGQKSEDLAAIEVSPGLDSLDQINLANGMRSFVGRPHRTALFSEALLVIRAGTTVAGPTQGELARIAAMAFLSGRRSPEAPPVRVELAHLGVICDFTVGREMTVFRFAVPTANTVSFLHLLADLVDRRLLSASLWEEAVARRAQELAETDSDGWQRATSLLQNLLWKQTDSLSPMLTPSTINQRILSAFWSKAYTPENMILSVWGELPAEDVKHSITSEFSRLDRGHANDSSAALLPEPAPRNQNSLRCLRDPGAVPAALLVGAGAHLADDRSFYAWQLGVHILGASSNSRLQRRLRMESQVVYTVEAAGVPTGTRGLTLRIACQTDQVDATRKIILRELRRLVEVPVSQNELDVARALLRSRLKLDSASFRDQFYRRSLNLLSSERVRDPYGAEVILAAFTPASLLEALRSSLNPEQSATVVISSHAEPICNEQKGSE